MEVYRMFCLKPQIRSFMSRTKAASLGGKDGLQLNTEVEAISF